MTTTITSGPLTFVRGDVCGAEIWRVSLPADLDIPAYCLKKYEGQPSPHNAFSGWRVVAGGPFSSAGGWNTLEEAVAGATPWLVRRLTIHAQQALEDAQRKEAAAKTLIARLTAS